MDGKPNSAKSTLPESLAYLKCDFYLIYTKQA